MTKQQFEMVIDFYKSASRFVKNGMGFTPDKILENRESICRSCDKWDKEAFNKTGKCRECGCSTWAKLRMTTERCPLGKWDAVDISTK